MEPDTAAGRAQQGLRLFAWAFGIKEGLSLVVQILFMLLPYLVSWDGATAESLDGGWGLPEWYRLIGSLNLGIQVLGMGACALGLGLWAGLAEQAGAGRPAYAAAVCYGLAAGLLLTWLLLQLCHVEPAFDSWVGRAMWITTPLVEVAGLFLLVFGAGRVQRAFGGPPPGLGLAVYAVGGLCFLLPFIGRLLQLLDQPISSLAVIWSVLSIATALLNLGLLILVVLLVGEHRRRLSAGPAAAAPAPETASGLDLAQAPWPTVRSGLSTYRTGLLIKIWIVLGGVGLVLLASLARSLGLVKGLLLLTSLGGLVGSGWMLFGLFGYAQLPGSSGGRGGAVAGLVLIGLALLGDVYGLTLVVRLVSSERMSELRAIMQQSPWVEGASQLIGLCGLCGLLFSFRAVARHVGAPEVSRRVGSVAGLLVATAVGAILVRALAAQGALAGAGVLVLGAGMLVLAIVALVGYLGVLKALGRAIGAFGQARVFD